MKKVLLAAIGLTCLLVLSLTGCSSIGLVVGVGNVADKTFDYKDFTDVEVSSAFEYDITRADNYSVIVSAHENLLDRVDVSQSGKTLTIRLQPGNYTNTSAKATITMPELNRLTVSGASRGTAKGFVSTNNFDLKVSGASRLDMDITAGQTSADISGASRVSGNLIAQDTALKVSGASRFDVGGSAQVTDVEVSGASQVNSPDFQLQDANAHVSGASRATINTSGTLSLDVTGASTLNYLGNPHLNKINVNGASRIVSK
jgi:hypothetical protein